MSRTHIDILIAEDNDDDVVMLREAFAKVEYSTILNVVKDGEEALIYLRRQGRYKDSKQPDILLLDINMPKKNGFEVLKEIKSDQRLQNLPVTMLTSSNEEEDIARSYSEGACSYLIKPVNFSDFQKLIERFEIYWTLVSRVPFPRN